MDYDETLEGQLCPNKALLARLHGYRAAIRANRLERIVSTRVIGELFGMVANSGWTFDKCDDKVFAGWRADEVAKVKGAR